MRTLLVVIIGIIFLGGCKSDIDVFIPDEELLDQPVLESGNISRFHETVQRGPAYYQIDLQTENLIQTASGTLLEVPSSGLLDAEGKVVTGTVQVGIIELYRKGEFIIYNLPTLPNNQIEELAGAFFMQIEQNGKLLSLKEDQQLDLRFKLRAPLDSVQLYYGASNNGNPERWIIDQEHSLQYEKIWNETLDEDEVFVNCKVKQFGWLNCGRAYASEKNEVTIFIQLPLNYNTTNSNAFVAFKERNALLNFTANEMDGNPQFWISGDFAGEPLEVVVLADQGSDFAFHFANQPLLVQDTTIALDLVPKSRPVGQILEYIYSL